ncbi:MAG: peptide-methionine (S)-S-oxide reductase MsrA [Bacteroidota bacterium]
MKPIQKVIYLSVLFFFSQCTTHAQTRPATLTPPKGKAIAVFAQGCFWCSEHIFEAVVGVEGAVSGYSGGNVPNPTYEQVGGEMTGHAESVYVIYDPKIINYSELVKVFFASHDPTTPNQQGPDRGPSYRSIAFYQNESEKEIIENEIAALTASKQFKKKIVTEVKKLEKFYIAENYHQNYINLHPENPYVQNVSIPRFEKFKMNYKGKFKE